MMNPLVKRMRDKKRLGKNRMLLMNILGGVLSVPLIIIVGLFTILINSFLIIKLGIYSSVLRIPIILTIFLCIAILIDLYYRRPNKYYVRKIEPEEIKGKKLIHYSNRISDEDYEFYLATGKVKLKAIPSAKANYVMKLKDRRKKYIWFHQEEKDNEPSFNSLYFSHIHENVPRKYKVTIDANDINHSNIFIRPGNNNIIVLGDLEVNAKIETEFKFLNDKFYLGRVLLGGISPYNPKWYYTMFHQILGSIIDSYKNKKVIEN
ncbi:hypothetical protein ABER75_11885 [Niallia taxi]|uniref:hypothetical protein n=1 Tax=Niallia taxi TaxID=2499688 RepID=UPI003D2E8C59